MVGLYSGTHSRLAVLGGILTIAIADALSDALGIHISEESKNSYSSAHVWEATLATFLTKFLIAMTFSVPVFLLPLKTAVLDRLIGRDGVGAALNFEASTPGKSDGEIHSDPSCRACPE